MARWDPGTEDRLRAAALELFTERGYDQVTVTDIAARAGITRRSYFRYFPDKREVLFAHSDQLPGMVAAAIHADDRDVGAFTVVRDALTAVGTYLTEHVEHVAERRAVIASSPELQERERTKLATINTAIHHALLDRGSADGQARAVAQIATSIFTTAYAQWADSQGNADFITCVHAAITAFREALAAT